MVYRNQSKRHGTNGDMVDSNEDVITKDRTVKDEVFSNSECNEYQRS